MNDLAMLIVEDDLLGRGTALTTGDIPELQDAVTVVGYPTGGTHLGSVNNINKDR